VIRATFRSPLLSVSHFTFHVSFLVEELGLIRAPLAFTPGESGAESRLSSTNEKDEAAAEVPQLATPVLPSHFLTMRLGSLATVSLP
jgi:hypothetical protein